MGLGLRVDPAGGYPLVVGVELLPGLHDLPEGLVVALADDDDVEVGRVCPVQPRALLQVLHHVLQQESSGRMKFPAELDETSICQIPVNPSTGPGV